MHPHSLGATGRSALAVLTVFVCYCSSDFHQHVHIMISVIKSTPYPRVKCQKDKQLTFRNRETRQPVPEPARPRSALATDARRLRLTKSSPCLQLSPVGQSTCRVVAILVSAFSDSDFPATKLQIYLYRDLPSSCQCPCHPLP